MKLISMIGILLLGWFAIKAYHVVSWIFYTGMAIVGIAAAMMLAFGLIGEDK